MVKSTETQHTRREVEMKIIGYYAYRVANEKHLPFYFSHFFCLVKRR